MAIRLLLINPKYPESFWSFRWAIERVLPRKRAVNPPLGLATLAALCPPDWEVEIIDENVDSVPLAPRADIIGVCGMGIQFSRQKELLDFYRYRGFFTAAGGSYASLCPEAYAGIADAVISGEAEYLWPRFCRDYTAGAPQPFYRESGTVAMADSPTPRFDLLRLDKYSTITLQFSRGCPYRCEFCDIIVMFGRKPRCKTLEQVGRELDALRRHGVRNAFFVDDNLIGNKPLAKRLLRFLGDYQREHRYTFNFGAEVSLNVAQDEELLQLLRRAHFAWVFVGIESPDPDTLRQMRKTQNTHAGALDSVRAIYAHGIDVLAGFIIGFDNDTLDTFDLQYRFIVDSGIQAAMVGLLTALPRTPLYQRLQSEGRLRPHAAHDNNTSLATNVIPKHMAYDQMIAAYLRLYRRLLRDKIIARRIRNKLRHMPGPVYRGEYSAGDLWRLLSRFVIRGLLAGGLPRIVHFLGSVPWTAPRKLPLCIVDWISGLAMRDYIERRFGMAVRAHEAKTRRLIAAARRAVTPRLPDGRDGFHLRRSLADALHLYVSLNGCPEHRVFVRAGQHLQRLLNKTSLCITLQIDELHAAAAQDLQRLLRKLARHGDRISVVINEKLYGAIAIDSSVFRLALNSDLK
jgi:radical SAM superfamily enzyme YgiQ (UPF0313 family)